MAAARSVSLVPWGVPPGSIVDMLCWPRLLPKASNLAHTSCKEGAPSSPLAVISSSSSSSWGRPDAGRDTRRSTTRWVSHRPSRRASPPRACRAPAARHQSDPDRRRQATERREEEAVRWPGMYWRRRAGGRSSRTDPKEEQEEEEEEGYYYYYSHHHPYYYPRGSERTAEAGGEEGGGGGGELGGGGGRLAGDLTGGGGGHTPLTADIPPLLPLPPPTQPIVGRPSPARVHRHLYPDTPWPRPPSPPSRHPHHRPVLCAYWGLAGDQCFGT